MTLPSSSLLGFGPVREIRSLSAGILEKGSVDHIVLTYDKFGATRILREHILLVFQRTIT